MLRLNTETRPRHFKTYRDETLDSTVRDREHILSAMSNEACRRRWYPAESRRRPSSRQASCQLSLASQWRWLGRWPACDRSQLCQARRHCSLWTLSMASFCCFPLFLEFCSMLYTVSLVTLPFTVPLPKQVMCNSATARCYLQDTFFILYLKDTFRKYLEILKTLFWRYVSKILFNWTLVCRQQIRACFRQLTNQSTDVFVYKFAAVSICRALSKNWIL